MKNVKVLVGALAICAAAPAAFAHQYFDEPYLGVEVMQNNQDYKAGYGKNVFKKNTQEYGVFGGFKFHKHFGVEAGYGQQPRRHKTANLEAGDYLPGSPTALTGAAIVDSRIRAAHTYVGVFGEWKCHHKIKLQALLAASISNYKANSAVTSLNGATVSQAVFDLSKRTYSKTKVVPMVKLSGVYNATHHVGVRASVMYRNTSSFKMMSQTPNSTAEVRLKDTFGVGLGVMYTF